MKMLAKIFKNALVLLILSSSLKVDAAKRRSRVDLPILNPADAPSKDNLATPSGSEMIIENMKQNNIITVTSEKTDLIDVDRVSEYSNEDISYDECDSDNISFELVTG